MVDIQTQLWIWDRKITNLLVLNAALDSHSDLRFIFLCMEWAMHGALWLIFSSFMFLLSVKYNFSLNTRYKLTVLILGLYADLVIVGTVKGIVKRSRPSFDVKDQLYEAPYFDKFSFPSGHSSRSAMLSILCLNFYSLPYFITFFLKLFPFILGASRIFIGRHYASDVVMGLLLVMNNEILDLMPGYSSWSNIYVAL
ncbi:Polyisoprenoid diphosphate/phosphate phosphohydrolase PLPP6 [Dirofilaria immitis]